MTAPVRLERVGRYELILELGSSALGPLWAARVLDGPEHGRIVTVRRLALDRLPEPLAARVTETCFAASEVRHPNVVALLDVLRLERELCVVGEYVEGESLDSVQRLMRAQPLPVSPAIALRIASDLIGALAATYETLSARLAGDGARCPYGGLLPSSITVASFGDVMLSDVGLGVAATRLASFAAQADALAYRAPEAITPGAQPGGPVDERADVFTLGVLLWELMANQRLFAGVDAEATRQRVLELSVPRLDAAQHGTRIPGPVARVVEKALERDLQARYPSLAALHAAVHALPRGSIASSEQVARWLTGLARDAGQTRRQEIQRLVRASVSDSAGPPSERPTQRPRAAKPSIDRTPASPTRGTPLMTAPKPPAPRAPSVPKTQLIVAAPRPIRPADRPDDAPPAAAPPAPPAPPAPVVAPALAPTAPDEPVLRPDGVVPVSTGSSAAQPGPNAAPNDAEVLRAAFAAARAAELAEPSAPLPPVASFDALNAGAAHALEAPPSPPRVIPAPDRDARIRRIVFIVLGVVLLIGLIALIRAVFS